MNSNPNINCYYFWRKGVGKGVIVFPFFSVSMFVHNFFFAFYSEMSKLIITSHSSEKVLLFKLGPRLPSLYPT